MSDLGTRPSAADFRGEVLTAGDRGYDEARAVFNGSIDRRPARIMRCLDTADVVAAVRTARDLDLPLSVYGGGHGVTGAAVVEGGLCLDLRRIDWVVVDPVARTARVGGGATWGTVDAATQEHGLAVTGGRVSSTGVGGLTLGSGSGWLERAFGYTCDNLLAAEVVTADGMVVTASEDEHPDLFWALRGGGGNFGIVTTFTLRLHPVGPLVLGGMQMYPMQRARDVVRQWRDFMLTAPDEVGSALAFITAPPLPEVPEPVRGHPVLGMVLVWAGDPDEGRTAMAPLLELGPPAVSMVQPMPYVAVQQMLDPPNPKGMQNYWSADFLGSLPDEAVDVLVEQASRPASPLTQVLLAAGGGAIARVPNDATALAERTAPFNTHYLGMWADPADDDANIAQIRGIAAAMKPWTTGRVYLNFIGDEGSGRVESAYGPERYARLQQIKRTWDPDNLLRHNQNITPAKDPA